jgi:hypothetical protein
MTPFTKIEIKGEVSRHRKATKESVYDPVDEIKPSAYRV